VVLSFATTRECFQESEDARRELVLVANSKQMAREARRQAAKHTAAFQVAGKMSVTLTKIIKGNPLYPTP
jgi:hypothetical protein